MRLWSNATRHPSTRRPWLYATLLSVALVASCVGCMTPAANTPKPGTADKLPVTCGYVRVSNAALERVSVWTSAGWLGDVESRATRSLSTCGHAAAAPIIYLAPAGGPLAAVRVRLGPFLGPHAYRVRYGPPDASQRPPLAGVRARTPAPSRAQPGPSRA